MGAGISTCVAFGARTSELVLCGEVSSGKMRVGRFNCGRREELASQPDRRIKEPVLLPAILVSDRGNQPQGCPCMNSVYVSVIEKLSSGRCFNPLKPELNRICYLLTLLGAHHFLHVSRIRVKLLTFSLLMSYIYEATILDVSRSHTTTQHSR